MDTLNIQQSLNSNFPIYSGIIIGLSVLLLNFICVKIYSYVKKLPFSFFWSLKYIPVLKISPNWDIDELKKRLRLVIIDDVNTFPLEQFKDYGYSIDYWEKVQNLKKLEDGFYDIIILDIGGVAEEISEDDGFGVMERLKTNNPAQIIIAYSQLTFDFSKARFWELADDKIAKPSLFLKIEKTVSNIIEKKLNIDNYINVLRNCMVSHNIKEKEIKKYETILYCSIKNKREPQWDKVLKFTENDRLSYTQIKSISKTIINYFQK